MREKVLIGLACPDGTLSAELQDYLAVLGHASESGQLPYEFAIARVDRQRPVAYAENLLVGKFLASGCDRLWLLAADAIPYPSTHRLLELDVDLALGWSWLFKPSEAGQTLPTLARNVLREADATGTAFSSVDFDPNSAEPLTGIVAGMHSAAIRRRVFDSPGMRLPADWTDSAGRPRRLSRDDPGYAPPYFRTLYRPDGYVERTDDFDFCWRARQAGFSVALHPGSFSGHARLGDVGIFAQQIEKLLSLALQPTKGYADVARDH